MSCAVRPLPRPPGHGPPRPPPPVLLRTSAPQVRGDGEPPPEKAAGKGKGRSCWGKWLPCWSKDKGAAQQQDQVGWPGGGGHGRGVGTGGGLCLGLVLPHAVKQ